MDLPGDKNIDKYKETIIDRIINTWLKDAEDHFIYPQVRELRELDTKLLREIANTNPQSGFRLDDPSTSDKFKSVMYRMAKRRHISEFIQEAKDEGLFEISEHLTSQTLIGFSEDRLKFLHNQSIYNKDSIAKSTYCGCFYCLRVFTIDNEEITEWVDPNGDTALCPYCGIDSVLPDYTADIDAHTLHKMNEHYFSRGTTYVMQDGEIVETKEWEKDKT